MGPLANLGINPGLFCVQIVAFGVLYTLLSRFLYDPIMNALRDRRTRIQKGLEDAAEAARARQNAERDAEGIMAEARAEAAKIIEEARGRGDELAASIETGAKADAERIASEAAISAAGARDTELAGMRQQVLDISSAVAGKILGEKIDSKKQSGLVNEFFSTVPAEASGFSGPVDVVTAMPLTDDEKKSASKKIGGDINFRVDPSILGGMVVTSGDRVIDGSVRSNLAGVTGRLN